MGWWGERVASFWLWRRGARILERNVRIGGGEIDLVALDRSCLVFVEVKSRRARPGSLPGWERIDRRKERAVRRAARAWLGATGSRGRLARIDVVAVDFPARGPALWPRSVRRIEDGVPLD